MSRDELSKLSIISHHRALSKLTANFKVLRGFVIGQSLILISSQVNRNEKKKLKRKKTLTFRSRDNKSCPLVKDRNPYQVSLAETAVKLKSGRY